MELDEVVGRIFGRHKLLLVVCVVVGLLAAMAVHWNDKPQYASSARLMIGTEDPTSSAQATALADTVRALATGPELVAAALRDAGAVRDATAVAAQDVDVQALGSSGVVQLTVTDPDPKVAVNLAGALASAVVKARTQDATAASAATLASLAGRIADLRGQIADTDTAAAALSPRIGSADPSVANQARAQRDLLAAQAASMSQQLDVLLTDQGTNEGQRALRPTAALVDAATSPAQPVPGRRLADLALGGLLGLLLGIALAATIESLRPSVVGRSGLARSIQAPILAELSGTADDWAVPEVAEAAMHVEMAAAGADVRRVEFIGTGHKTDLARLAEAIGSAAPHIAVSHVDARAARLAGPDQSAASVRRGVSRDLSGRRGIVVVVPSAVHLSDLDPVKDFVSISGWPLLGVIVCQPSSRRSGRVEESASSEGVPA
ncbi:MAG: hypothetical protein ACHQE5_06580 [Actinomycetes bacterium]